MHESCSEDLTVYTVPVRREKIKTSVLVGQDRDRDKSRTVVMDKNKGEPVISVQSEEKKEGETPVEDKVKTEGGEENAPEITKEEGATTSAGTEGGMKFILQKCLSC